VLMFCEMTKDIDKCGIDSRRAEAPRNGYLPTNDGPPQNSYIHIDGLTEDPMATIALFSRVYRPA
jgi:hypothetical protein